MTHCRRRKLVQGAEPPHEVVAAMDGFAAVANALKESTDALPAVKSICGAVDWIVTHIKVSFTGDCFVQHLTHYRRQLFHSNKSDWKELAIFVIELFYRIRDKLDAVKNQPGLESELQSHLQTLERCVHQNSIPVPLIEVYQRTTLHSRWDAQDETATVYIRDIANSRGSEENRWVSPTD